MSVLRVMGCALVFLLACGGGGGDDDDTPGVDAATADGAAALAIPDPGNADGDWGFGVVSPCCATPDTAYRVGLVTQDPGYVQGDIDTASLSFFYVFRTGPAYTELNWSGGIDMDYVHLYEGSGLVLGGLVTPSASTASTGTWSVSADSIYVLELHSKSGGFF
jgi:hypothetical protein